MDVYNVGIVQQCQMLESKLNTYTLAMCIRQPLEATSTVASKKSAILEADFDKLLLTVTTTPLNLLPLWLKLHHGAHSGT